MQDAERQKKIADLRRRVKSGEYKVDEAEVAASVVDEHLTVKPKPRSAAATASNTGNGKERERG